MNNYKYITRWPGIAVLLIFAVCTVVLANEIRSEQAAKKIIESKNSLNQVTPTPNPTPAPASTQTGTGITVPELLRNKSTYFEKNVTVNGIIEIIPRYSEEKCMDSNPCDTLYSIDLYLKSSTTSEKIPIYKDGKPYPCIKSGNSFVCGSYINNQSVALSSILLKSKQELYYVEVK